MIDVSTSKR